MIGLLDLDVVCYRCGFSVEKKKQVEHRPLEGQVITEYLRDVEPLSHALQNTDTLMKSIVAKFDKTEGFLSGKNNWRKEEFPDYKANRSPFARPYWYKEIRQHLIDKWKANVVNGMEADDAIGIRQTQNNADDTCIVSIDKDLLQIPGHYWNFVKDESRYTSYEDGLRYFYQQVLSGDSVDNVRGLDGIGPKKAARIVRGFSTERGMFQAVQAEYYRRLPGGRDGKSRDEVLEENALLLWIARTGKQRWTRPE